MSSIPFPNRDSQGKVTGSFYPLQKEELMALRKNKLINNAAFVHLALRSENPFCDRPIEIIPKEFSMRWQIPESSVYEAIAKLKESEVIHIQSGKVIIQWANTQQPSIDDPQLETTDDSQQPSIDDSQLETTDDSQQVSDSGNPELFWEPRIDSGNPELILEIQNEFWESRTNSGFPENRSLEPSPCKGSKSPQTNSDYSNFIQTLSDGERESFLEFGRKKAAAMPNPPQLPDKWIAAHFTELYRQFVASPAGREAKKQAITAQYDWHNDPRFNDWIWKAFNGGYLWAQEDEAEREDRYAFYCWAQETNAYEGVCY